MRGKMVMTIKKKIRSIRRELTTVLLLLPAALVCLPVILLVTGSVMGNGELKQCLAPIFAEELQFVTWKFIPDYPTFENYGKLLFMTQQFFVLF